MATHYDYRINGASNWRPERTADSAIIADLMDRGMVSQAADHIMAHAEPHICDNPDCGAFDLFEHIPVERY